MSASEGKIYGLPSVTQTPFFANLTIISTETDGFTYVATTLLKIQAFSCESCATCIFSSYYQ